MDDHSRWQHVWITGASSGIGLELAKLVADCAEHVTVSARSVDKLFALSSQYPNMSARSVDVSDREAVGACVEAAEADKGAIDLAVLNAGIWQYMRVGQFDIDVVRRSLEVNYMGVMHGLEKVLPGMMSRRRGHIAIVASVAGYRGLPGATAYGPTKAALINLAETLRTELEGFGITVTLINPGFVDTPMTEVNDFPMPNMISSKQAAQRMLRGLKAKDYEIVFPRRFVWQLKILRLLPNPIYFWVVRNFISGKKL